MKFLNNFISQLTPFFFFSIGGYLVLQGSVTLGALVAALAAYKDLSSPWKELLAYYNQTQDMSLRWDVIVERFAPPGMLDEALFEGKPDSLPHLNGDIELDGVSVRDGDGTLVLEDINITLPAGAVVGISVPSEEDRRALAGLLTRELMATTGVVRLSGHDLKTLHQDVIATRIGYASSRPLMFQGTFGDNVMMPIRLHPQSGPTDKADYNEAIRAGNSADPLSADWLDPTISGFTNPAELHGWWLQLIDGMGSGAALFRRGLEQSVDATNHPDLAARLVALRPEIKAAVHEAGLDRHVYFLDPDQYNPALPVAENLLFATPRQPITPDLLAGQVEFLTKMRALKLDEELVSLTQDVIDMLRHIFGLDGTDHPLFRNLGLDAKTYEVAVELVEKTRKGGAKVLNLRELAYLLTVTFMISAEQIGPAFSDDIKGRILRLRHSHSADLLSSLGDTFAPLDAEKFAPGLTVLENALFGRISQDAGGRADDLRSLIADIVAKSGAQDLVIALIYDVSIALNGANLPAHLSEPLSFSRATIKRPDILILDQALASFDMDTQVAVFKNLRALMPDTTLIYINDQFQNQSVFDLYFEVQQGRIVREDMPEEAAGDSAAGADLARKVRALEQTDLFSGLDRKQMRLLAFGARWFHATAGEVVFEKDDAPTDGAYMIINGEAGLYRPKSGAPDQLVAKVGPGKLVGELGLIRNEPRALSMIADSDITCLRIGAPEFLAVVENDAATAFKLLQVVSGYVSNG